MVRSLSALRPVQTLHRFDFAAAVPRHNGLFITLNVVIVTKVASLDNSFEALKWVKSKLCFETAQKLVLERIFKDMFLRSSYLKKQASLF